jgi:hypothetical protein
MGSPIESPERTTAGRPWQPPHPRIVRAGRGLVSRTRETQASAFLTHHPRLNALIVSFLDTLRYGR